MRVHLVFATQYRRKVFDGDAIARLHAIFGKVCEEFEARLVEYLPKAAVSALVDSIKGVSSRLLRRDRLDLATHYWQGVLWSPSYFAASCCDAPISIVRQYIEQQKTSDGKGR